LGEGESHRLAEFAIERGAGYAHVREDMGAGPIEQAPVPADLPPRQNHGAGP
jgi:hypothetical protein